MLKSVVEKLVAEGKLLPQALDTWVVKGGEPKRKMSYEGPPPLPKCIHLGMALPREVGPCLQRRRKCDEFGICTLVRCDRAEHSCDNCPSYEGS